MLGEPLAPGLAIPLLECLRGDLSLDEELRELATLCLAFERHHASFLPSSASAGGGLVYRRWYGSFVVVLAAAVAILGLLIWWTDRKQTRLEDSL